MCRIIFHPKYSLYNLGDSHPFSPQRVEMLIELLQELKVYKQPDEPLEVELEILKMVHSEKYIDLAEELSVGVRSSNYEDYGLGTSDNPIVDGMSAGARYQVGGSLLGAQMLINGSAEKVLQLGGGFHHAHYERAAGFCLYNDIAVAIKEMIKSDWHVAYLDIDVHHGDGVQELFYSDDKVMTISIHESGEYLFPGKGWIHELGQGMGRSLKLNIPLEPFSEGNSYLEALDKVVQPALSWFKPDALIVQAGADAHFSDPLADNLLTTHDYEFIFKRVINIADQNCNGRVLFTLGGGYSPSATPRIWAILYLLLNQLEIPAYLPSNWRNRWQKRLNMKIPETFHDQIPAFEIIPRKNEILKANKDIMRRLMDSVSQYWM